MSRSQKHLQRLKTVSSACCYFLPTPGTRTLSLKGTSLDLPFTAQRSIQLLFLFSLFTRGALLTVPLSPVQLHPFNIINWPQTHMPVSSSVASWSQPNWSSVGQAALLQSHKWQQQNCSLKCYILSQGRNRTKQLIEIILFF